MVVEFSTVTYLILEESNHRHKFIRSQISENLAAARDRLNYLMELCHPPFMIRFLVTLARELQVILSNSTP